MAKEVTPGTPVIPTNFLPMTSNTMEVDPGWFSPQVMMGSRDVQVYNLYGEQKATGAIAGPLFPSNGVAVLAAAIGADTVSGTAPYTHTVVPGNTLSSLTVEKNIGGFQSLQFAGCKVGKLTLKAAAGNSAADVSYDVTGTTVTVLGTPTAVSVINESPFVFAQASVSLFGGARAECSSMQIVVDNGLKATYTFGGSNAPTFITPVSLKVNGTADVVFDSLDDATYGDYAKAVAGTTGAISLTLSQGASVSVALACPQVVISKYTNDLKVADVIMSALTFEATRPATGSTVSAVIKNAVSSAY